MEGSVYYGSAGKRPHQDDDGGDRNGRQKKKSNTSDDHQSAQTEDTEYRILCPGSKIGSLIGKGGAIIKALRLECRSKIKVEDPVSGSDERVVLITSSSDQFREGSPYLCYAQEALFKVHARITEDDDDEPPQPVTVRLLVPKNHIGCLLGKGGKIIAQMRKDYGAQIRILPKEQHPPCAASTDELVQVTGDSSVVRKALYGISTRLHENITGDRSQRMQASFMPSLHAPPGGIYPSSAYLSHAGSLLGPSSVGGPIAGLGYSYGGLYGESGMAGSWSLGSGLSMPPSASAAAAARSEGAEEEELSIRLLCPNTRIGSIIGKGGSVIKKMREETGAKIKVGDQVPDCDERVIHITSAEFVDVYPSPGVQAALQIFRRLVELQMDKDKDNRSFMMRMLVPSSQIGCLLGKGGTIVTEMRKVTKANIRISPKDEPSKCAEENDELVQIMGDQTVVQDALIQVLNRLRSNLFKGHENQDMSHLYGSSMLSSSSVYSGANMLGGYASRLDTSSLGGMYPLTNIGYYGMDYGYAGYGAAGLSGSGLQQTSSVREGKETRRRQR